MHNEVSDADLGGQAWAPPTSNFVAEMLLTLTLTVNVIKMSQCEPPYKNSWIRTCSYMHN